MKHNRKTALSLGLVAALAVGVTTASPVYAAGNHGERTSQYSQGGMMGSQSGQFEHGGSMGRRGGQFDHGGNMGSQGDQYQHGGEMGDQGGMMQKMMQMRGQMGGIGFMQDFDADGDGIVTPEELRAGLQTLLAEYDANGDGTLSISEFEALNSAAIREQMVDRFQMLDNDGDGQVTADEITAPADRMDNMMNFKTGKTGPHGAFGGQNMGADSDTMMQNQGN